jgi:hypothetical protein
MSGLLKGLGMFGNGAGADQPQDTKSLWGDMFGLSGLSGLMKVITDPALVAHAHQMMQATIEGANASRRIEAKLDRLLGALGHEISDINSRFPAAFQPAVLLEGNGGNAPGPHPAATGAPDHGSAPASGGAGPVVGGDELRRDDHQAG